MANAKYVKVETKQLGEVSCSYGGETIGETGLLKMSMVLAVTWWQMSIVTRHFDLYHCHTRKSTNLSAYTMPETISRLTQHSMKKQGKIVMNPSGYNNRRERGKMVEWTKNRRERREEVSAYVNEFFRGWERIFLAHAKRKSKKGTLPASVPFQVFKNSIWPSYKAIAMQVHLYVTECWVSSKLTDPAAISTVVGIATICLCEVFL